MQRQETFKNPETMQMNLSDMDALSLGEEAVVFEVPDIRLLSSLGIRVGKTIRILTKSFASGPLILSVNSRSIVIDRTIAKQIIVKR